MADGKYLKSNLKNNLLANLAGFILVITFLLYFIIMPAIKEIKTISHNLAEQREYLEKQYSKSQNLKKTAESLNRIEPKLKLLDRIFINKNRELEFITSLEDKANLNQINQRINLNSPQTTNNEDFQIINLQLSSEGEFIKQLKYLMDLESLSYYINIKSLELSSSPRDGKAIPNIKNSGQETLVSEDESSQINLSVTADTYWK